MPNTDQFLEYMRDLISAAADIRTPLGKDVADTTDVRKAITIFLTNNVDDVRRIRDNMKRPSASVGTDE